MSRVGQAERMADLEAEYYAEQLARGAISREAYSEAMRQLQREVRYAYEADLEDALRDVDAEWGLR